MSKPITDSPAAGQYDVVIVGGAIVGSAVAWFLAHDLGFEGAVLVVERDMTYKDSSTALTTGCMRQQFSNPLNIEISQFAAEYVRNFRDHMGDEEAPEIFVNNFGYMYLVADEAAAGTLRANQAVQADLGAATTIWPPEEIAATYPFYNVADIVCGSHNLVDEGYFDSNTMFDWWRRKAREHGVEYTVGEVVGIERVDDRVRSVTLASGVSVACGAVVDAAGTRASSLAAMAGLELPVEPRKRYTFVFDCAERLSRDVPLTVDPTGVYVRSDGTAYMAGCAPDDDRAVKPDDFGLDDDIWEAKVWPALAHRIPAFERIKVTARWAGHYAFNRVDRNAIVGPHPEVANFYFANGFSGHGLQQAPAVGRGVAELISYGGYRSLDLTPLGFQRIIDNRPFIETAII